MERHGDIPPLIYPMGWCEVGSQALGTTRVAPEFWTAPAHGIYITLLWDKFAAILALSSLIRCVRGQNP